MIVFIVIGTALNLFLLVCMFVMARNAFKKLFEANGTQAPARGKRTAKPALQPNQATADVTEEENPETPVHEQLYGRQQTEQELADEAERAVLELAKEGKWPPKARFE